MLINIPLNIFTIASIALIFVYVVTHAGETEQKGWLFSGQTLMVLAFAMIVFCIGYDTGAIGHLFAWK